MRTPVGRWARIAAMLRGVYRYRRFCACAVVVRRLFRPFLCLITCVKNARYIDALECFRSAFF